MSLEIEGAVKTLGPRGGDLTNPDLAGKREWQKAELNTEILPNGTVGMHRFDREYHETATPGLKNEQTWHTMAAYMLLAGRTNSEIAAAARVHPTHVSYLRGQKWFQQKLAVLANNDGEELLGIVKGEALASVETLVSLRDNSNVTDAVRRSAAKDLIEFAHGKAVQRTIAISATTHFDSPQDEMEQIQEELATLRRRSSAESKPVLEAVTLTSPEIAASP